MNEIVESSPVGRLLLQSNGAAVTGLTWTRGRHAKGSSDRVLAKAAAWLNDYFARRFRPVDFPVRAEGSEHQQRVWAALREIPLGAVATYGDVAREIGSAPRAVGTACGANPVTIVIPCHRVVGAAGSLGGYSGTGGLGTKRKLLQLEAAPLAARTPLFEGLEARRATAR